MINTADTVYHRPTGETYQVACVHGDDLFTLGYPARKARAIARPRAFLAVDAGGRNRDTLDHQTTFLRRLARRRAG